MKAKLTQELQQAKNAHNILQAELDKVGAPSPLFLIPVICVLQLTQAAWKEKMLYPHFPFQTGEQMEPVWVWILSFREEDSE